MSSSLDLPITSTLKIDPLSFDVFQISKHEVWRLSRSGCQQMRLEAYYERISSDEYAHTMTNPKSATRHARGRLDTGSDGVLAGDSETLLKCVLACLEHAF